MEQVSHVFNFCYTDFYILYIVYMICTTKLQFVCFFIKPELLYLHFHMDILSVILSSSLQKPFPQDSWNHPWHSWEMYSYKKLNVQCRVLCNMFCVITSLKSQAPRFYVNITLSQICDLIQCWRCIFPTHHVCWFNTFQRAVSAVLLFAGNLL